ncbi:unnamed protein product [Arctia plantaginis]|uniref:Uncharacterized protein n=1 Tax=Arctia plantaginis TaxID=874455 RepID=A0A8S1ABG0_ARCPL|nr:unnamed protein product [Arctia plantaginis]
MSTFNCTKRELIVSYIEGGKTTAASKKRKNTVLRNEYGLEHILSAYLQGLRSIGKGNEAKAVEKLRLADAEKKVFVINQLDDAKIIKGLTDEEALSVFIDLELTKVQYLYLRNVTDERNCSLFPPYCKIQEMKEICYPPSSTIEITNTYAKIS